MFERTVTISSSGKTFSFTGWKIGWATGPADLVAAVEGAKNWLSYSSGAPFQPAIAHALDHEDAFHERLRDDLSDRRDYLCDGLDALGLEVHVPAGHLLRDHRRLHARATPTAGPSAPAWPSGPRSWRSPPRSSTRTARTRAGTWSGGRSARSRSVLDEGIRRLRARRPARLSAGYQGPDGNRAGFRSGGWPPAEAAASWQPGLAGRRERRRPGRRAVAPAADGAGRTRPASGALNRPAIVTPQAIWCSEADREREGRASRAAPALAASR